MCFVDLSDAQMKRRKKMGGGAQKRLGKKKSWTKGNKNIFGIELACNSEDNGVIVVVEKEFSLT